VPGQHDAVRVAEPQPLISKKYAPELYEIENLVLVTILLWLSSLKEKKSSRF
jgi:DNA polymerase II small subunit/DNA polymerase delta subunit B